jgi:ribose transport system substrate-binding protein
MRDFQGAALEQFGATWLRKKMKPSSAEVAIIHLFFACGVLAFACCLSGCRKQGTTISVIPRSAGTLLWEPLREGVEDAAKGTRFRIDWKSTSDADDIGTQLALFTSAMARGDRGIIFTPDETLAARSFVLEAVRRQIPVVVVDDEFGPPAGPLLSYVANDETIGTRLAAQRLAKTLNGHGSIVIIGINAKLEGSVSREGLLEAALREFAPGLRITLRQFGDASITHQQQICQELLDAPTPPDAIVALSPTATRGAYYAKIASERHPSSVIIGFDQDLALPIRTGNVDAVVMQDTRTIGRDAMQNMLAQLKGEIVPAKTTVPPVLVTKGNLDSPAVVSILTMDQVSNEGEVRFGASQNGLRSSYATTDETSFLNEAKKHELQPGGQEIGSFIRVPGLHPGVTIQGAVISLPPLLGVQDATSSTFISSFTSKDQLKLGDVVAVHGDLISERFRSHMENASIRVLWSDRPIPPLAVTASQITGGYRGEAIEVEGTLVSEKTTDGIPDLVLRDQGYTFRSLVYSSPKAPAERFAVGSRVRVRGIATSLPRLTDGIYPFTVIADQVELLEPPPWWSPSHIALLVISAIALLFSIQWFLHLAHGWHMRSVLKEREQLAFEMHDTLSQCFTGIAYQLHAARAERKGGDAVQAHIGSALEMVTMSHREASRTIAALRPQHRDGHGIISALKQLAERLGAGGDLAVHTVLRGRSSQLRIDVAEAFFSIGQEAISNAILHGHCHTLWVELQITRRTATLRVRDDGVGFSSALERTGMGISGMRRWSERIRATFALTSSIGNGTTVEVSCVVLFMSGILHSLRQRIATRLTPRSQF